MSGDCGLVSHVAGKLVQDGWNIWGNKADAAFATAQEFLTDLNALDLAPIHTSVDFNVPDGLGHQFQKPTVPVLPSIAFNSPGAVPAAPGLQDIGTPAFNDPPELEAERPLIVSPVKPGPFSVNAPGQAPELSDVEVPAAPDIELPAVPALRDLTLPDVPSVSLPEFTVARPDMGVLNAPGEIFYFTEPAYESDLLDTLTARVQEYIIGGTGVPDAIWTAIWDKARSREVDTARAAKEQAADEWSARGFSLPPGVLSARMAETDQKVLDASNQLSREQAIKQAEMEQGNIQFAITQGIALENALQQLHLAKAQRAFEVAKFIFEAAVSVFQAKVQRYNAELEGYKTDASVYKTLIEAELANVELYRAELEGQKLIGELNLQDLELYKTRVDALLSHVELYKSQVAGVEAQVNVDRARVEAFQARVGAFGEQVNAYTGTVRAYAEEVRAETSKAQMYESDVNAYAARVRAYGDEVSAKKSQAELVNMQNETVVRRFTAQLEAFKAQVDAEAERVKGVATAYDAESRLYSTELNVENARVQADTRQFELAMRKGEAEARLKIQEATMNIEQAMRILALEQDRNKTSAQVASQLAAAALAAVSLSASVGETASNSTGCTTSYNYDQTA